VTSARQVVVRDREHATIGRAQRPGERCASVEP